MKDGPIRIFVASDERMSRIESVLEYSARKNCSAPDRLQFFWMRAGDPGFTGWSGQPELPYTRDPRWWGTRFTMFRYAVPALCGFSGFACYFDCDQLVLGDLVEFWNLREAGKWRIAVQDSVSLIDCSVVRGKEGFCLDSLRRSHQPKGRIRNQVPQDRRLPATWNSLDRCADDTDLIHFTDMRTQPWKPWPDAFRYDRDHPCHRAVEVFDSYEKEARACEFEISQTPWLCSPEGE